jgi:hypothetical protein
MGSKFTRKWIIESGVPIVGDYGGNITLRGLHYLLVAQGMTNDLLHYKKVISAMVSARWAGDVGFDAFLDHERESIGQTEYEPTDVESSVDEAEQQIREWATSYHKNRWENQNAYVEVFIEKKTLQGIFQEPCSEWGVALNPCKGYPSLTFLYDAKKRFDEAMCNDKEPVILYFGDYDCSGEDIPRSIGETLDRMGTPVEIRRIALVLQQVEEWGLPPAPTKVQDSRARNWDGIGQVELDAVEPRKLTKLCNDAIEDTFDEDAYEELQEQEAEEQAEFKNTLMKDFKSLLD